MTNLVEETEVKSTILDFEVEMYTICTEELSTHLRIQSLHNIILINSK